jgi:hypothetical protein
MAIAQRNVQIEASPQETTALLSDASRWPEWYPGMTEIKIAAPFREAGGKVAFKVKSAGMSMPWMICCSAQSPAICVVPL